MDEREILKNLEDEDYQSVEAVSFEPDQIMGEHTHDVETVHIIFEGELIIIDENGERHFRKGDRAIFPAGTKHLAKAGKNGLSFIIGFKK